MFRLAAQRSRAPRRQGSNYEVGSVRKAMEILCAFTVDSPLWTLTEISLKLKIPKSTALNLLRTLESFELVKKDPRDKRYQLGPRIFQLSPMPSQNVQLGAKAAPHLHSLAEQTGETVKLGVLFNGKGLILAAIESKFMLHTRGDEGRLAPLHCTGIGKALLASQRDSDLHESEGRQSLRRFTDRTITRWKRLEEEIAKIREAGYSVDREEHEAGVCCIGAMIHTPEGWPPAAISISGPSSRITPHRITKFAPLAMAACRAISDSLVESMGERRTAWPKRQK